MNGTSTGTVVATLVLALSGCASSTGVRPEEPATPDFQQLEAMRTEAEIAYAAREWPRAAAAYRALVGAIPNEASYWFRLGTAEARSGNPEPAVRALQEAVLRDPQMSKAWYNMSVVHLRRAENSLTQLIQYGAQGDPNIARADALLDALARALASAAESGAPDDSEATAP